MTQRARNNPERTAAMVNALIKAPQTYDQLEIVSGLNKTVVASWVKGLRAAGAMHIAAYSRDALGRMYTPAFKWGKGVDARRAPKPTTERMREMRTRRKQDAELGL